MKKAVFLLFLLVGVNAALAVGPLPMMGAGGLPPSGPVFTPSLAGTVIAPGSSITDSNGAVWTIVAGVILKDGVATPSGGVTAALYYQNTVYQWNGVNWYGWLGSAWSGALPDDPRYTGFDPTNLVNVNGYKLVYDEEFNDLNGISFATPGSVAQGFNLYSSLNSNAWCGGPSPAGQFTHVNNAEGSHGGMHNAGRLNNCANDLTTWGYSTAHNHGPAAWEVNGVGHAFAGGYYSEWRAKWPIAPADSGGSFPAWWSFPAEWNTNNGGLSVPACGSPGRPVHYIEDDFLEIGAIDDPLWWNNTVWDVCDHGAGGSTNTTLRVDTINQHSTAYHTFGHLVIYGGPVGTCATGMMQNFVDNLPNGPRLTWTDCLPFTTIPQSYQGTNKFSTIDQQHPAVIIGSGVQMNVTSLWLHTYQLPYGASISGNPVISPQANYTGPGGAGHL